MYNTALIINSALSLEALYKTRSYSNSHDEFNPTIAYACSAISLVTTLIAPAQVSVPVTIGCRIINAIYRKSFLEAGLLPFASPLIGMVTGALHPTDMANIAAKMVATYNSTGLANFDALSPVSWLSLPFSLSKSLAMTTASCVYDLTKEPLTAHFLPHSSYLDNALNVAVPLATLGFWGSMLSSTIGLGGLSPRANQAAPYVNLATAACIVPMLVALTMPTLPTAVIINLACVIAKSKFTEKAMDIAR